MWCSSFSLQWLPLFRSTGSRVRGLQQLWHGSSLAMALGLSRSAACGIFWHWQLDSYPPCHQESLMMNFLRLHWPRPGLCWELGGHLHRAGLLGPLQRWEQRKGRPRSGVPCSAVGCRWGNRGIFSSSFSELTCQARMLPNACRGKSIL